jgi:L-2,4-diaminobutyrate transaminase
VEARPRELNLEATDRATVFHSNTNLRDFAHGQLGEPVIITGAQGLRIRDQRGREYIDAFASLWCVNVGYGRREIADALHRQALELAYYHGHAGHSSEPVIRLTRRVLDMTPSGMSRIFWGLQGSDAHETQVKIVWYCNNVLGRPAKKKIIARQRAYHGLTIMAGSLSGVPRYHRAFDLPLGPVRHTLAPYYYWREDPAMSEGDYARYCAAELERLIVAEGPETVAAFIGEPVMGVGGVLPPPDGYWPLVGDVLRKYDILLLSDEVVCGFGRVGANFGATLYDMRPDMMTISKGLTSGYFPLAGTVVSEKVWQILEQGSDVYGPFAHGFTYAAHPLGAAVALANLDIVERERLTENARTAGDHLRGRLRETLGRHPIVGDIRGVGLLACVELVADPARRRRFDPGLQVGVRVAQAARARGLIVRPLPDGDMIGFAPPLIITAAEVDQVVELARLAVADIADGLARDGVRLA